MKETSFAVLRIPPFIDHLGVAAIQRLGSSASLICTLISLYASGHIPFRFVTVPARLAQSEELCS